MTRPCGCCAGTNAVTPVPIANRPGLNALSYRVGTYATFFDAMIASLSSPAFPALAALRTREPDDPAIALLDAWAIVADVLTFYQERIANEGYLRTATERRSVLELARLVGYTLRPGVAATAYLAYTIDPSATSTIPTGSKTQSVPAQDQLPQSFETTTDVAAQGAWNNLTPRLTRPQIVTPSTSQVYVDGTGANLKPNDPLLIVASPPQLQRVAAVDVQFQNSRTRVTLQNAPAPAAARQTVTSSLLSAASLVGPLTKPPAAHPANSERLEHSVSRTFAPQSDTLPALLKTLHPELETQLYKALGNTAATVPVPGQVHALRVQAAPFGSTAPLRPITDDKGAVIGTEEWPLEGSIIIKIEILAQSEDEVRGGELGRGHLQALVTGGGPSALITITKGAQSASVVILLSSAPKVVPIGVWTVEASFDLRSREIDVTFPDPLNRSFKITFETKPSLIDVSVDQAAPVRVAPGQSTRSSTGAHRISVSALRGIEIVDESALSPDRKVLNLDSVYDQILPGSWIVVERPDWLQALITTVDSARKVSVTNYGMSARVTQLTLAAEWLGPNDLMLSAVRSAAISAQSERLTLAEEPIDPIAEPVSGDQIELGGLYGNLQPGRWLIVRGERTDVPNTTGVPGAEVVMLDGVEQKVQQVTVPAAAPSAAPVTMDRPGETIHSFLRLASGLAYSYKRDTVAIDGNVSQVTHGETKTEILGSGDGTRAMQRFTLHASPVTHLPASTRTGSQSTLTVFVDDVQWQEVDTLVTAGPSDRCYAARTDDSDVTTIMFGDGVHGMRPPTGVQNVKAVYRVGIGAPGNVDAGQASLLATRPLGVTGVTNPIPATGGADRDSRDQARANTPLAVAALDCLVSVRDYADFARSFAGIGKANAVSLSDGHRQIVHVTIAGPDGGRVTNTSGVYLNLLQAFHQLGDPNLPIQVDSREAMLLVIVARVGLQPGYQWESVAPHVRSALQGAFGFARRDLGQSVALSEVITTIQQMPGVAFADVTNLDSISESDAATPNALQSKLAEVVGASAPKARIDVLAARLDPTTRAVQPAQAAFLSPDLEDTVILTEIAS